VSLAPSLTEMLFAIDCGQAGRGGRRVLQLPSAHAKDDLSGYKPNAEAIAKLLSPTSSWSRDDSEEHRQLS
jgi:hypothetical protein